MFKVTLSITDWRGLATLAMSGDGGLAGGASRWAWALARKLGGTYQTYSACRVARWRSSADVRDG